MCFEILKIFKNWKNFDIAFFKKFAYASILCICKNFFNFSKFFSQPIFCSLFPSSFRPQYYWIRNRVDYERSLLCPPTNNGRRRGCVVCMVQIGQRAQERWKLEAGEKCICLGWLVPTVIVTSCINPSFPRLHERRNRVSPDSPWCLFRKSKRYRVVAALWKKWREWSFACWVFLAYVDFWEFY